MSAGIVLLLVAQCFVIYVVLRQYGRALLWQDDLTRRVAVLEDAIRNLSSRAVPAEGARDQAAVPSFVGLPVGAQAPDFTLPDLEGRPRRLAEYLGQPRVAMFFSLDCGFCQEMAPRIGQLSLDAPRLLVISRGSAAENRRLAQEHAWSADILIEPNWDVAQAYQANGTPTGYLLDAQGRIASNLLVGADALFAALQPGTDSDGLNADALRAKEQAAAERAHAAGLRVRESRLNREGLAAGTPAPDFELPDLDGNPRSLRDFHGQRVLLVFSDPQCGPCQALAPDLERLHEQQNTLQVVMISRGDLEANRAKAREHGLTFPVLLQRHWEISSAYGLFATPVGYVIDEQGVITREPAIGGHAILAAAR